MNEKRCNRFTPEHLLLTQEFPFSQQWILSGKSERNFKEILCKKNELVVVTFELSRIIYTELWIIGQGLNKN